MLIRKIFTALMLIFIAAICPASAVNDFPYLNVMLKVPGVEDPIPGLGNNYSALSNGIETVLTNPAGLGKIKDSEISIGFTTTPLSPPYLKKFEVKDATFEVGSGSLGFTNAVLFTSDLNATIATTREYTGHMNYSTVSTGIGYKQAIKIADMFAFGVSTRGDTGVSFNLAGDFPAQWKSDIDLLNVSDFMGSGISTNNGKLTYKYTPSGGSPYTYTSEASVWSGFLKQSQRIPFTAISNSNNDIDVRSDVTLSGAAKWQGLSVGANLTPISATANIANSVRLIVKEGTGDVFFYVPNFDPNNEASVIQWLQDPNLYGTQAGYNKRYFRVPEGETVAEAKYNGFYSASALRMDLGAIYDLGNILTLSFALENFNGAALDFKGSGRVAFVNSRVNTQESGNLIDPAGTSFNFFSDSFTTPPGIPDNLGMPASIPVMLPQKTKIGAALRKPFLIALDYEQQNNPFSYSYNNSADQQVTMTISDIKYLRGAFETQLLMIPIWFRGGLTAILKPALGGVVEPQTRDSVDKMFKFGLLPVKLDLGSNISLFGLDIGESFGINILPFIYALQLDTTNPDFTRINYYNFYLKRDWWQVTYSSILDPGSSVAAYSALTQPERDNMDFNRVLSVLKFVNTLTISMRF